MKLVIAIVRPFVAEGVLNAIADLAVEDVTIREAKGFGRQKNYLDLYRNNEFSLMFVAKVEISMLVADDLVEAVIKRITDASRTGRLGDGKILVLPLAGEPVPLD